MPVADKEKIREIYEALPKLIIDSPAIEENNYESFGKSWAKLRFSSLGE